MNQGVASHSKIDLRLRSSALARNTTHKTKMDKRRIRIATKILEEVKAQFPETAEFIDYRLEQRYSKEKKPVEEVIFLFTCLE